MSEQADGVPVGERFPSVAAIRLAHGDLLKRYTATDGGAITLLAEINEFVIRAKSSGALLDNEDDRWFVQGLLDYWAAALLRNGRSIGDTTVDAFDPELAPTIPDEDCPFVGLDAFQESDALKFFGRRRLVADVLRLLDRTRLVVMFGQSGSGKSSLMRSGVIPALKRGGFPASERWRYLPPFVPGSDPLGALARCLDSAAANRDSPSIDPAQFLADPAVVRNAVSGSNAPAVLCVDQFEELFTLTDDRAHRQAFVSQILALTDTPAPRHVVLMTMRSDYETFIAQMPRLQKRIEGHTFRITPMDATELREAIEGPSAVVGLRFEAGIVDALLADTLGEPAALPLLQFTLWKLWNHRARNRIIWDAYKKLGGGRLALARSADAFYDSLIPENQVTARRILLRMVRPGDGLEVTSSRVRRSALFERSDDPDRVARVLDQLIEQRLVRLSPGETGDDDQVEVAHEALVRNWPRLVEWLEQERQEIATRRRLEAKAVEWKRLGSGASGLLDEGQLYEAERWLQSPAAEALGYEPGLGVLVRASREAIDTARADAEAARQREVEQARQLAVVERQRADENALALKRIRRYAFAAFVLVGAVALTGVIAFVMAYRARAASNEANTLRVQQADLQRRVADEARVRSETLRVEAEDQRRRADEARLKAEQQSNELKNTLAELRRAYAERDLARSANTTYGAPTGPTDPKPLPPGPQTTPIAIGDRVGAQRGGIGTLCCFAINSSGDRFAVSMRHVFDGRVGDLAWRAPASTSPGTGLKDVIGTIARLGSDVARSGSLVLVQKGVAIAPGPTGKLAFRGVAPVTTSLIGRTVFMITGRGLIRTRVMGIEYQTGEQRVPAGGDIVLTRVSEPGDSGAPIVTEDGMLIGVLWGGDAKMNLAVPATRLFEELSVALITTAD